MAGTQQEWRSFLGSVELLSNLPGTRRVRILDSAALDEIAGVAV